MILGMTAGDGDDGDDDVDHGDTTVGASPSMSIIVSLDIMVGCSVCSVCLSSVHRSSISLQFGSTTDCAVDANTCPLILHLLP